MFACHFRGGVELPKESATRHLALNNETELHAGLSTIKPTAGQPQVLTLGAFLAPLLIRTETLLGRGTPKQSGKPPVSTPFGWNWNFD